MALGRLLAIFFTSAWFFRVAAAPVAQTNSWTNATSGNWENAYWSLGALPGTNQTILLTNSGWKALEIGPGTVQDVPDSLIVGSLIISSPGTDTVNTLLLNYAGLQTPLQIEGAGTQGELTLGTNCALVMLSSALKAQSPQGELDGNFFVEGAFSESEGSDVAVGTMNVGDTAAGIFHLTNSMLNANWEYIGAYQATFSQQGGTNSARVVLEPGGGYELFDGTVEGTVQMSGGTFNQFGGELSVAFDFGNGSYHLAGGTVSCDSLTIPAGLPPGAEGGGTFYQTGGTNSPGAISLGTPDGSGNYNLSGGVLVTSGVGLSTSDGASGNVSLSGFIQSGGYHQTGGIGIGGAETRFFTVAPSIYQLTGGILDAGGINMNMGIFEQTGGTNVAGTITLGGVSSFELSGGWLTVNTIQHNGGNFFNEFGRFDQSGGTNQVGTLTLSNSAVYNLSGGKLLAGKILVDHSTFNNTLSSNSSSSPGSITLADGTWNQQASGAQSFGTFQLSGDTNSYLVLPHEACLLNFGISIALNWSNTATLKIDNWSGSIYGGGNQQIVFGSNAAALALHQVRQIQFENPAGLAPGTYTARMLTTGEIVPDTGQALPLKINSANMLSNGLFELGIEGIIGRSYNIEVSTDLVNWVLWTNEVDSTGTFHVRDWEAANYPLRFYRVEWVK